MAPAPADAGGTELSPAPGGCGRADAWAQWSAQGTASRAQVLELLSKLMRARGAEASGAHCPQAELPAPAARPAEEARRAAGGGAPEAFAAATTTSGRESSQFVFSEPLAAGSASECPVDEEQFAVEPMPANSGSSSTPTCCAAAGVADGVELPVTTLMLRNIPPEYDQDLLLEDLEIAGCYDLFYLPRIAGGKANLRYAFVNFVSAESAASFQARWCGRRLARYAGAKRLSIVPAGVQGFEANVRQLQTSLSTMRARRCLPVILRGGIRLNLEDA